MAFEAAYDIVVAGAGVAGVAAALEASRSGFRTALVEKTIFTGGLATTGLINIYLPLCDGMGHQVIYGIAEELLHLSLRYGPGDVPAGWRDGSDRYRTPFAPAAFILALDEVLEDAGVDLWFDTLVCQPVLEKRTRLTGLEVENKSGRGLLRAACIVDATGDADVAFRAGAPCVEADNGLSMWALQVSLEAARQAVEGGNVGALLDVVRLGAAPSGRGQPEGLERLHGTVGSQVTRFVLESRHLLRTYYRQRQSEVDTYDRPGRQVLFPTTLPAMAQFRTTRRIEGRATLSDGQHGAHVETSVGLAPDWRRAGPVWELPYGILLPQQVTGLLTAGRCISSEGDAWEITRVIPPAALTGQVAGIAAGLAVRADLTPDQVSARAVQATLRQKGLPFHIEDVR